jgi:putative Ig domain-containing protein
MARRAGFPLFISVLVFSCVFYAGCAGTPRGLQHLAITTTSLPSAQVNGAYSATVNASGGVAPFSWSVASGTLPNPLALGTSTTNAVTISGTPLAQGTFTFTIKVTDSTGAAATSSSLTIEVSNLAITTTSPLPGGSVGAAYNLQFAASGGTAPYQWAEATGSTLPAGLSLSSTGLLSGTPTVSTTATFGVTVTDSETPAAAVTETFTLTISGPTGLTLLEGNYAFEFSGFNSAGPVILGGSFQADGKGGLSNGVEDLNTTLSHTGQTFSGTYTLGGDNRGTLVFASLAGSPTYAFAIDSTGSHGRFIEFDASGIRGSGEIEKQSVTTCAFTTINGEYAVGITGNSTALGGFTAGPVAVAGRFTATPPANAGGQGSFGNGEMDANTPGFVPLTQESVSGTYHTNSSPASCTATISPASLPTLTFNAYPVSTSELFLIETDTVSANTPFLTVGKLLQQVGYPFSGASGGFTATSVGGLKGEFSSGSGYVPDVAIASLTASGTGNLSITIVENRAGTVNNFSGNAQFVNADLFGRVGTNITTPVAPVFYMINQNEAFAIGEINNNPFFGILLPQASATFTAATLDGAFVEGTSAPTTNAVRDISGVLNLNGIQTVAGTQDQSTASLNTPGQTVAGSYAIVTPAAAGEGTVTFTAPAALTGAFLIVSDTQFVLVTTTPGDLDPVLIFAGN